MNCLPLSLFFTILLHLGLSIVFSFEQFVPYFCFLKVLERLYYNAAICSHFISLFWHLFYFSCLSCWTAILFPFCPNFHLSFTTSTAYSFYVLRLDSICISVWSSSQLLPYASSLGFSVLQSIKLCYQLLNFFYFFLINQLEVQTFEFFALQQCNCLIDMQSFETINKITH